MGMSVSAGAKGGRRRRGVPRYGAMAEINMTPFIDVMLVLLIIFMVAAPLLSTGLPIDLPSTSAGALNVPPNPINVSVDQVGQIYVNDQPFSDLSGATERVRTLSNGNMETRIFISGHRSVNYERVTQIMAQLTSAGFSKAALRTRVLDDSDFRK